MPETMGYQFVEMEVMKADEYDHFLFDPFETTDMVEAKKAMRDRCCIRGNVPASLMATGTPEQVREYCKTLIDVCGEDGGFILDSATDLRDAKVENVEAMFAFTREYGVY